MNCKIILETYNKINNNILDKKKEINLSYDSPLLKSYLLEDYNNLELFNKDLLEKYNECKKKKI